VKHRIRVCYHSVGDPGFQQVGLDELNSRFVEVVLNILDLSATEVIHDSNPRSSLHQGID